MGYFKIQIEELSVPEYWSMGEGNLKVNLKARNSDGLDDLIGHPGNITIHLSTDTQIDNLSEFSVQTIFIPEIQENQTFDINFQQFVANPDTPYDLALAPGRYYVHASVAGGDGGFELGTQSAYTDATYAAVSAPGSDVMIDWISTVLVSTQAEGLKGNADAPYNGNRLMAMSSLAAYDIIAAKPGGQLKPYLLNNSDYEKSPFDFSDEANEKLATAAINSSYQTIFTSEFSAQSDLFNEQYQTTRNELLSQGISESELERAENYGRSVGYRYIEARSNDGTNNTTPFQYSIGDPEGFVWTPASSGPAAGVSGGPNRGEVDPFVVPSIASFSATNNQSHLTTGDDPNYPVDLQINYRPNDGDGSRYVEEYELSRIFGARYSTPLTQNIKNQDQAQTGAFYSQDENDSWQPWGLPNYIAAAIALKSGNSLKENAQFFASLHSSITDATTMAWYSKYRELIPKPSQVITDYADNDGFDQTVYDPAWKSGLTEIIPGQQNPHFPDYVSGHSAIYGAWASVMDAFYGNDPQWKEFWSSSQTLEGQLRMLDGYIDPYTGLQNSSFKEMAMEATQSRFYWGVHTPSGTGASFLTGQNIGNYVMHNEIFGTPLINPNFDGLPGWSQFDPAYTAWPVFPSIKNIQNELDNIIFGPSFIGFSDGDGAIGFS